jgi:low temperature requirement protein LtrA
MPGRLDRPPGLDRAVRRGLLRPLGLLEVAVPIWAESAEQPTTWHAEHIAERYGLFTLIVLGECVLAATTAIEGAITESGLSWPLAFTAIGALLLVFGTWWSYFKTPVGELLRDSREVSFLWGYGHYLVFAAIAALGAGLSLAAESAHHTAHVPDIVAALAVAVPMVVYLVALLMVDVPLYHGAPVPIVSVAVGCAGLLLAAGAAYFQGTAVAVLLMGLVLAGLVAFHVLRIGRTSSARTARSTAHSWWRRSAACWRSSASSCSGPPERSPGGPAGRSWCCSADSRSC